MIYGYSRASAAGSLGALSLHVLHSVTVFFVSGSAARNIDVSVFGIDAQSVDVQPARQGLSLRFQFLPLVLTRCQLQRSTCIPHGFDRCAGGPSDHRRALEATP